MRQPLYQFKVVDQRLWLLQTILTCPGVSQTWWSELRAGFKPELNLSIISENTQAISKQKNKKQKTKGKKYVFP